MPYFNLHYIQLKFPLRILLQFVDCLQVCCLIPKVLGDFPVILLLLIFSLIPLCSKNILWWFQFFKYLSFFFFSCGTRCLSWCMFHGHWKKICTLLLLDGVSCKCWLDPVVDEVFNSLISLLIFCLVALSIVKRTMMKSLTIYLFCFIYFASNVASEFIFMIVIASCWIDPFISISPLSLSLAIFFFLESALSMLSKEHASLYPQSAEQSHERVIWSNI